MMQSIRLEVVTRAETLGYLRLHTSIPVSCLSLADTKLLDIDDVEVEPAARRQTFPPTTGRRDRQKALEIGWKVGVDLATTGDLDKLRRIPLHGFTSHCIPTELNMRSDTHQGKSIFLEQAIRSLDQGGLVGLS